LDESLALKAALAEAELAGPGFGDLPPFDFERAALLALIGVIAGHVLARHLR
jgi:hypothetical protein